MFDVLSVRSSGIRSIALALLALLVPGAAQAVAPIQEGSNLGVGVGGGMGATGLSVKYFVGADFAIQGVIGGWNLLGIGSNSWNLAGASGFDRDIGGFAFNVDALLESQPWVNGSAVDLAFNGGVGLNVAPGNYDWIGVSLVGGFEVDLEVVPFDIVLEYRPNFWIASDFANGGSFGDNLDWFAFVGHIRVYPFPAGPK